MLQVEISSAGFKSRAPLVGSVVGQLGDDITVHVTTSDAEGLPIYIRESFLMVSLPTLTNPVLLRQSDAHPEVHEAVLPDEWFVSEGKYDLIISVMQNASQGATRSVQVSVDLRSPWLYLAVAGGAGLGTMLVLLGLLGTLLLLSPDKSRDEIKLLVKSFVVFEMKIWFICTTDQIDLVLDTQNLLAVLRDSNATSRLAYTAIFGCNAVASVCAVIAFLRLLVIRLLTRFRTYALPVGFRCTISSTEWQRKRPMWL